MILGINGIIASSISGVDADAAAFFARVTAAGGTLSATEKTAVNTLVVQMKADGTWTPMKAIYPMVGASAAACAQNLKSSSFTGTFTSGWTFASTGVTPNGTSAYMDTGLNWSTNTTLNNVSVGCYWRDIPLSQKYYGLIDGTLYMIIRDRAVCDYYINDNGTGVIATMARGLHSATRKSSTQTTLYVNGSGSAQTAASTSKPNLNLWYGAINGAASYTNNQMALGFISDGLDATQNTNFYTAVQAFQTTLSRQV
jgi:hypothetical protein